MAPRRGAPWGCWIGAGEGSGGGGGGRRRRGRGPAMRAGRLNERCRGPRPIPTVMQEQRRCKLMVAGGLPRGGGSGGSGGSGDGGGDGMPEAAAPRRWVCMRPPARVPTCRAGEGRRRAAVGAAMREVVVAGTRGARDHQATSAECLTSAENGSSEAEVQLRKIGSEASSRAGAGLSCYAGLHGAAISKPSTAP